MSNTKTIKVNTSTAINKYPGTLIHFMYDDPAEAEAAYAKALAEKQKSERKRNRSKCKPKPKTPSTIISLEKFFVK